MTALLAREDLPLHAMVTVDPAAVFDRKTFGSTSVLGAPPRSTPARLRRVFDGATRAGVSDATDPSWGRDSIEMPAKE